MVVTWVGGGWANRSVLKPEHVVASLWTDGPKKQSYSFVYLFIDNSILWTIENHHNLRLGVSYEHTQKLCPQGHIKKIEKAPCFISNLYHLVNILDFLMSKKDIKLKEKNSTEPKLCSQDFDKDLGIFLPAHPRSIADRMNSI